MNIPLSSALERSIRENNVENIKKILEANRILEGIALEIEDITPEIDFTTISPLHIAIEDEPDLNMIRFLLYVGFDPRRKHDFKGGEGWNRWEATPSHYMSTYEKEEAANLLLASEYLLELIDIVADHYIQDASEEKSQDEEEDQTNAININMGFRTSRLIMDAIDKDSDFVHTFWLHLMNCNIYEYIYSENNETDYFASEYITKTDNPDLVIQHLIEIIGKQFSNHDAFRDDARITWAMFWLAKESIFSAIKVLEILGVPEEEEHANAAILRSAAINQLRTEEADRILLSDYPFFKEGDSSVKISSNEDIIEDDIKLK